MVPTTKLAGEVRKRCVARRGHAIAWLAFGAGLFACRPAQVREVALVYAADQAGYLAPCGCSQHQLGGAARAVTALKELADAGPTFFIEGGNFFFDAASVSDPDKRAQDRSKALALAKSWQDGLGGMRAVAWGLGPLDALLGAPFAASTLGATPLLEAPRLVELGGVKIGLFPLSAETADAKAAVRALRQLGADVVIALVQAEPRLASELVDTLGADLALQSGIADPVQDTDEAAATQRPTPTFRVKDKGRGLLALQLHVPPHAKPGVLVLEGSDTRQARADALAAVIASNRARLAEQADGGPLSELLARKIAEAEARRTELLSAPPAPPADRITVNYRFLDLTEAIPEDPAAAEIFANYTAALQKANLSAQAKKACPAPKANELHFMGAESCQDCHAEAYATYLGTKHPLALQKLIAKSRQYDLDCINCHVLGYEKPGGVCRLDQIKPVAEGGLAGVQCESCHGMGSAHVQSGGETPISVRGPGYETCYGCHDPKNDNRFNRETFVSYYLPSILGPGHGQDRKKALGEPKPLP